MKDVFYKTEFLELKNATEMKNAQDGINSQ